MDALLPQALTVKAGGEELSISPFAFGQYPKVASHLHAIAGIIKGDGIAIEDLLSAAFLTRLTAVAGEDVIGLCGLATGKPREWFDRLPGDEGVLLATAVVKVNVDFFAQRVAPALTATLAEVPGASSTSKKS